MKTILSSKKSMIVGHLLSYKNYLTCAIFTRVTMIIPMNCSALVHRILARRLALHGCLV